MADNAKTTVDQGAREHLDPSTYQRPEVTDLGSLTDITLGGAQPAIDAANGAGSA